MSSQFIFEYFALYALVHASLLRVLELKIIPLTAYFAEA